MALIKTTPTITDMIEEVYEHETSMKGWDSSFIESIRDFYYEQNGLSEKQLAAVQRKYDHMNDGAKSLR